MKAKLVKIDYQFFLYNAEDDLIATTEESPYQRLSVKNCEDIERGYDLDKLFESIPRNLTDENDKWKLRAGFITGFQKALEILSDKKFSEEDMKKSFILGCEKRLTHPYHVEIETKPLLQQTEWEVEIVTKPYTEVGEGFNLEQKREPKLDRDGCLILKRIFPDSSN